MLEYAYDNVFPNRGLQEDDHKVIIVVVPRDLYICHASAWANDFFGRHTHVIGPSRSDWVYALVASASSPSQSSSLEIASNIFAAATREADVPCSEKTAR